MTEDIVFSWPYISYLKLNVFLLPLISAKTLREKRGEVNRSVYEEEKKKKRRI